VDLGLDLQFNGTTSKNKKGEFMLRAAITFFILALVAYILGAYQVAGISAEIGKVLLGLFLFISILLFISALFIGSRLKRQL
jgi:uncharacterized membrane protein YtjA (UPF0391 family)